jgi:hypothetical protein
LKTVHPALALLRHLRVDDPAARRHPLHITRAQITAITQMVLMQHVSFQHVGDGFKTAVRVLGKASQIIVGIGGGEFIQQ